MNFDLDTWASSFNPTPDRPSPDFSQPELAAKLQFDLPRLVYAMGLRPPFGVDPDDWMQDLRMTVYARSLGKGKWDSARGRGMVSWMCMCAKSRSMNLHRTATSKKANVIMLCTTGQVEAGLIESYSGEGIGLQNGIPKWQRSAKAAGQRASRAAAQRLRRAAKAQAGQGSGRGLEAATGAPAGL
jgi:hypothetical protein